MAHLSQRVCLRSFQSRRRRTDHGVMKPSTSNRQLLGLSATRGEPTASPELRWGWMQATTSPLLAEREGKNFFLTSPLIGLIEVALYGFSALAGWRRCTNVLQQCSTSTLPTMHDSHYGVTGPMRRSWVRLSLLEEHQSRATSGRSRSWERRYDFWAWMSMPRRLP